MYFEGEQKKSFKMDRIQIWLKIWLKIQIKK